MRKYINKPTDQYVTGFESMVLDSVMAMTNCMAEVARDRITSEINDRYPDAETIATEGKFLENVSNFRDLLCDLNNADLNCDENLYKMFKKQLKNDAEFIRQDVGDRATLRDLLTDMFSECVDRKCCIEKIIKLIF